MAINYKVAIVSMCGTYYDDNAAILDMTSADYEHRSFITIFGNETDGTNAVQNLKDRTDNRNINGYENGHGQTSLQSMDKGTLATTLWFNTILGQGTPTTGSSAPTYSGLQLAELMGTTAPMSASGAHMTTSSNATMVQLEDFTPIKALKNVWVTNIKVQFRPNAIKVPVGGEYYLIDITCGGFDEDNVPYYGFQSSWGSWELLDDNTGQPLDPSIGRDHPAAPPPARISSTSTRNMTVSSSSTLSLKTPTNRKKRTTIPLTPISTPTAYVDVVVEAAAATSPPMRTSTAMPGYSDAVDFMDDQGYMKGTGRYRL